MKVSGKAAAIATGIAVFVIAAVVALVMIFAPTVTAGERAAAAFGERDGEAMLALNNARAYAAAHEFTARSEGEIRARVFGIPYVQKVSASRSVFADGCTERAESVSAFAKAAVDKCARGGKYTASRGEYVRKQFDYAPPAEYTYSQYVALYGKPAVGLVKYELDGAIVGARTLSPGEYEFELEPRRAAAYVRNEIKTMLGSKAYPQYSSISFVLRCDGERPISVTAKENFTVDKFGGVDCAAQYTETFDFAAKPQ